MIRAIKMHPSHQVLSPNDYMDGNRGLAAIYERAQANGLPTMVHTGTSIFPGARNLHAQPMLCDDAGIDYPDLVVILAHGGRQLWMKGLLPRSPAQEYVHGHLRHPAAETHGVFSAHRRHRRQSAVGHWPGLGVPAIKGNIEKFNALPISNDAKRKILYDNAARLFPR